MAYLEDEDKIERQCEKCGRSFSIKVGLYMRLARQGDVVCYLCHVRQTKSHVDRMLKYISGSRPLIDEQAAIDRIEARIAGRNK